MSTAASLKNNGKRRGLNIFSGPYLASLEDGKRSFVYRGQFPCRAASPVAAADRALAWEIHEGLCSLNDALFHGANNYFEDLSAAWISVPKAVSASGLQSQYLKLVLLSDEFSRCYSLYSSSGRGQSTARNYSDFKIVEFNGNVDLETAKEIAEGALRAMLEKSLKRAGAALELYISQNDILRLGESLDSENFISLSTTQALQALRRIDPFADDTKEVLSDWEMLAVSQNLKRHFWLCDGGPVERQGAALVLCGFGPIAQCWIESTRVREIHAEFLDHGLEAPYAAEAPDSASESGAVFTSGFRIYWDSFLSWMLKLPSSEYEAYGSGRTLGV